MKTKTLVLLLAIVTAQMAVAVTPPHLDHQCHDYNTDTQTAWNNYVESMHTTQCTNWGSNLALEGNCTMIAPANIWNGSLNCQNVPNTDNGMCTMSGAIQCGGTRQNYTFSCSSEHGTPQATVNSSGATCHTYEMDFNITCDGEGLVYNAHPNP